MFTYVEQKQKSQSAIQKKEPNKAISSRNLTGIPDKMKAQFENLSGFSFDDVRVHYNSDKPVQLQALAYTQGNQVYVGSGQERHLPHELGHVVQQKQGRVYPTSAIGSVQINDNPKLEEEADNFGEGITIIHNNENGKVTGNTVQMLRMLGVPATPPPPNFLNQVALQAHHIIPNTVFQHAIEDKLNVVHNAIDVEAHRFDGQWNGIALPTGVNRVDVGPPNYLPGRPGHSAPHINYSADVEAYCVDALNNVDNDLSTLFDGQNANNIAYNLRQLIHNTAQQDLEGMSAAGEI